MTSKVRKVDKFQDLDIGPSPAEIKREYFTVAFTATSDAEFRVAEASNGDGNALNIVDHGHFGGATVLEVKMKEDVPYIAFRIGVSDRGVVKRGVEKNAEDPAPDDLAYYIYSRENQLIEAKRIDGSQTIEVNSRNIKRIVIRCWPTVDISPITFSEVQWEEY